MKRLFADKWFVQPYYSIEYKDGKITIRSSSKHKKGGEITQYDRQGYLYCKLTGMGAMAIHDIVAFRYLGFKPSGFTVNHKDGNKHNNRIENLEYLSIRDNILHSIRMGLHVCCDPTRMPTYKDGRCKDKPAYKAAWYQSNKERMAALAHARYLKNADRLKAYARAHYHANKK